MRISTALVLGIGVTIVSYQAAAHHSFAAEFDAAKPFELNGLAIEFVKDAQGVPTHLFDKHVSGDYRFDRTR
jgi:hypothetical protein